MAHSHLRQVAKFVASINLHISPPPNLEHYQKAIMFKPYSCGEHLDTEVEINRTGGYMTAHVFRLAQTDLNLWQSLPDQSRETEKLADTAISGFCHKDQVLCLSYSICPSPSLFWL